jgi:hypothetical protein
MVRWSFPRVGVRFGPDNLVDPLTVIPSQVLNRIATPEMTLAHYVFPESFKTPVQAERPRRRRVPIQGPTEFAVSLKAYVDKLPGTGPLCGHTEIQDEPEEGEIDSISTNFAMDIFSWVFRSGIEKIGFPSTTYFCEDHYFLTHLYSGGFLGVTDFSVWPVGNNREIESALFLGSEQDNHKQDNANYLQELDPGSNPGRRGGKPATNRLSYGTYMTRY